jgi:hypothetical protein
MKLRRLPINEAPPISDYLPDEFKQQARSSAVTQNPAERQEKMSQMMRAMMELPSSESANKEELEDLAVEALFRMYPDLEEMVVDGKIIIDAKLGSGGGGRITQQSYSPAELEKVKEKNPQFSELQKKRHYINAMTQGKSWVDGFNYVTVFMADELSDIDPNLYDKYRDFTKGISDYYWVNSDMLERMASQASGRLAYVDVQPTPDGKIKIEARAPFLPLLVHELIKGAEYYKSAFSLPKDPELRKALVKTTDIHKHEIQNMNYGRAIVNKMRELLNKYVNGYKPYMEVHVVSQLEMLPEGDFNQIMDGIVNNDNKMIMRFAAFAEKIVKEL